MPLSYSWTLITPSPTLVAPPPATVAIDEDSGSGYSIIRKHFNRFFSGPNWDAIIAALGEADDYIFELCRNVLAQFTESTATGPGLDVLGNNQAINRPWATGMTDDTYRKLLVSLNHNKVTYQSVLEVLEALYGLDNLRAYADSSAGPWSLVDGQSITFNFGGDETHTFWVTAEQFPTLGSVSAIELGVALADWFSLLGLNVPIAHNGSQLRFYSTARGVKSTLTIGGTANIGVTAGVHRFAGHVKAIQPADGRFVITVPAVAPSDRTDGDPTFGGDSLDVISLTRVSDSVLVETASAHGLTAGDKIELTNFTPARGVAYVAPVSGTNLGASRTRSRVDWTPTNILADGMIGLTLPTGGMLVGGGGSSTFVLATSLLSTSPNHSDQATQAVVTETYASMSAAHANGAASTLSGPFAGQALITGGDGGTKTVHRFDGTTWSVVASTIDDFEHHFQVTLANGDVLVGDGFCNRYNPTAGFWYEVGAMSETRYDAGAVLLSDGTVLVAGGQFRKSCELFNPDTNLWSYTSMLSTAGPGILLAINGGREAIFVPKLAGPVEIYTTATKLWRRIAYPFSGYGLVTAVIAENKLFCFYGGGMTAVLDLSTWRWTLAFGSANFERNAAVHLGGGWIFASGDDLNTVSVLFGDNYYQIARGINATHTVESVTSATTFTVPADNTTFTAMHSSVSASATRAGSTVTVSAIIPAGTTSVWVNSSNVNFVGGLKTVVANNGTTFTYTEAGAAVTGTISVGTTLSTPRIGLPVTTDSTGFVVGTSAATASTALTTEAKKIVSDILSPHMDLEWVSTTPDTQGLGRGDENWR